jgi:acetyl-CoA synthetase
VELPARLQEAIELGLRDPEEFWAQAADEIPWFTRWDRVFEHDYPTFRWFVGGTTNLSYNAVDVHVLAGRGAHTAVRYLNEHGEEHALTYQALRDEVCRTAAGLRALGVRRGDRVTLYMPTSVQALVAMLAVTRIGAIHSVVFAGFGAKALADRIIASGSTVVLTADVTWRKGKAVPLEPIVADALRTEGHQVRHVVVLRRQPAGSHEVIPSSLSWDDFLAGGAGHDDGHEVMEANEPAFILATSGTTATPKLAVHTHGGYQVHVSTMGRLCFGLNPSDVWWATSDVGWVVGHSYMVYGPLLAGATTVVFEGALDHPSPIAHWQRVVDGFGATGIFTSPTAVRLLRRYGEEVLAPVSHATLERVVCAGEVLNPQALEWLQDTVLGGRVPVIDNMWQTETGGPVVANPYGLSLMPIKPGAAGLPLPGISAAVVTLDGRECAPNEKGIMVITRPFPGLTPMLWGDPARYGRDYWERIHGSYYSGDSAYRDEDGYFWFCGRADEVIKIAAHRLGTIEVESAIVTHPSVAECGVVGRPDDVRGEVIAAFVLLKHGLEPSDTLRKEILGVVRRELGALAVIGEINFVALLPKTRSGKIMRRVLKAVVLDTDPGDITTIEDEGSVEEARAAWRALKGLTD